MLKIGEWDGMLKLDAENLAVDVAEPSQNVCPHWILVMLHQFARELLYMLLEVGFKLKRRLAGKKYKYSVAKGDEKPLAGKRVLFVRHGQGAHNATIKNWGLIDPELNAVGEQQVARLNTQLQPYLKDVEVVAVSPLTRALQVSPRLPSPPQPHP